MHHLKILGHYVLFIFLVGVCCLFFLNARIQYDVESYIIQHNTLDIPVDVVLILWAKVYSDGRLSRAVQDRADAAITLWRIWATKKILISGDNRTKYYDEVTTIKNYLLKQWIPKEVIFLDYAWLDTYDSMYRASYIFGAKSLLIPTQKFHLTRALYIARGLGIEAYGVITDTDTLAALQRLQIRELFAVVKARIEITFWSSPYHLGEKVPLSGPSNA